MLKENKLIIELAHQVEREKGKRDWVEVSNRLGRLYGIVKTPNACRKVVKRAGGLDLGDTLEFEKLENVSIEYSSDGTVLSERKIVMSESDSKNPEFVLQAHGFDPNEFELVSARNNFWTTNSAEVGESINYQSKITVRPKKASAELSKQDIVDLFSDLEIKPLKLDFKPIDLSKQSYALEIDFSDIHIGSLSWHEEVGEDYDYKIAFDQIKKQVEQAREIIETYNIDKVYICFLGDFLHIDNDGLTTTKGTKVDFDSRPKKMVMKALEMVRYIIERLAIKPTEVIWIEGNHSRLVEFTLFHAVPFIYQNSTHIKFDVTPKLRKAFVYGENLIGLHHGEMNKDKMYSWLQNEYRKEWGEAKYAETHSGHIHQEKVTEKGGIINRTNPTSKTQDLYEYQHGWVSQKASIAYLWSKKDKLKAQFYLR